MNKIPLPLKGLVFLILCLWLLSACRTIKESHTTETATVKTDSTRHDSLSVVNRTDSSSHELTTSDTTIGLQGGDLSFVFDGEAADDTMISTGNLSLHVYTDNKGNQHIDCKADSLTLVIRKITRELDYYRQGVDSIDKTLTEVKKSLVKDSSSVTLTEVAEKENTGFFGAIKGFLLWIFKYLIAAVIGAICWEIIKKLQPL